MKLWGTHDKEAKPVNVRLWFPDQACALSASR